MALSRRFPLLLVLLLVVSSTAVPRAQIAAPTSIAGAWDGVVQIGSSTLVLQVVFTETGGGWRGTMDIPQQGASALPLADLRVQGTSVRFELRLGTAAVFDGRIQEATISGTFTQGGATGTFSLVRAAPAAAPPYREQDVRVTNGDVTLAGTLSLPSGQGPFPAVVLITGSGPQNRDEDVLGFRIFAVIADHLARRGVAVYRYDDRGVGQSTGNLSTATTWDLAGDVSAVMAHLGTRPDIDRTKIGLLGHSEGASVASIVAGRTTTVAFAVLLAPPGLRTDELLRHQAGDGARAGGADEDAVVRIMAAHRRATEAARTNASPEVLANAVKGLIAAQFDSLGPAQRAAIGDRDTFVELNYRPAVAQLSSPWMKAMLDFNPLTTLRQMKCPVLALFGSLDTQVPPALNMTPVRSALGTNTTAVVRVYQGANHLFQAARTGQATEYGSLDKAFVPGLLDEVSSWIVGVVGR